MADSKFIESIKFKKWPKWKENTFPPFKWGDKVFFWGEGEMQKLIEFYLKGKQKVGTGLKPVPTDEEIKKNAKRFKINCVLGNNWGGKSRLLRGIDDSFKKPGGFSLHSDIEIYFWQTKYIDFFESKKLNARLKLWWTAYQRPDWIDSFLDDFMKDDYIFDLVMFFRGWWLNEAFLDSFFWRNKFSELMLSLNWTYNWKDRTSYQAPIKK